DFCFESEGAFAECDLQVITKIGASFRSPPATGAKNVAEAEEFSKDITEVLERGGIEAAEPALHSTVAKPVVASAFVGVAQDAIGLGGFLKVFLRFLATGVIVREVAVGHF